MNKSLVFVSGLCISSFVFLMFSVLVTEGRPIARAALGGIWYLLMLLMLHFSPELNLKKETNYQKFVLGLEIIIMVLWFFSIILGVGMIQESLEELGYVSGDVCIECGP